MCADHTYNGTPVRKLCRAKILDILSDGGIDVLDSDGRSNAEAWEMVKLRLEVELTVRALLQEAH